MVYFFLLFHCIFIFHPTLLVLCDFAVVLARILLAGANLLTLEVVTKYILLRTKSETARAKK